MFSTNSHTNTIFTELWLLKDIFFGQLINRVNFNQAFSLDDPPLPLVHKNKPLQFVERKNGLKNHAETRNFRARTHKGPIAFERDSLKILTVRV